MALTQVVLPRAGRPPRVPGRGRRRRVRTALPSESAVLWTLHRALVDDACAFETFLTPVPEPAGRGEGDEGTAGFVLVCEVRNAIVGYLSLVGIDDARWELRALGVTPEHRRTGVASALLHEALRRLPADVTRLEGSPPDERSAAWAEALGFTLDRADGMLRAHGDVVGLRARA
jgi:GNAT superfamily N-acetyltransferase